ncbi:TetR/AcrR family transcriptional regulator [Micromonospora sp. WMMD1155]|uniref:TetR/AcrR family transcriptional regulator n=1 Tax=Micromonospora sp. WMMD1155 TaxID=3016094 RepID=UPI00249AA016|nr:TetR/AcrR family transcriptional regulator [Micromonospora sp. WMMD1155]WFE54946.1 TetR/AcrR family transcriptional regulator [Micromonospora sp. WMMD1155]
MATAHDPSTPRRGRRPAQSVGDAREQAIMAGLERLLQSQTFAELSIDDIARGSGISRSGFYFYFPSKTSVLLALLDALAAEASTVLDPPSDATGDPRSQWHTWLTGIWTIFSARVAVVRACVALADPEVRAAWSAIMTAWGEGVERVVTAERAAGRAPVGIPAQDLATALIYLSERTMIATFVGDDPHIAPDRVVDTLVHIWMQSIYAPPSRGNSAAALWANR